MKILMIDDSALSRNMLKRAIGEQHQVVEAEDGMRGLELYFIERPELVFLDLTMPGMNGMDVLAQLKRMDPQARVIVGTADVQAITHQEALALGAAGVVVKPFTPESIQEAIRSAAPEA